MKTYVVRGWHVDAIDRDSVRAYDNLIATVAGANALGKDAAAVLGRISAYLGKDRPSVDCLTH